MKSILLIAAGVLALGWGTARAETSPSSVTSDPPDATTPPPHVNVDVDVSAAPPVVPDEETTIEPTTNVEANVTPLVVPAPVETRQAVDAERGRIYRSSVSPRGGGFFVGGGFEDFTNNSLRSMTGSGGYWSARIVGGMRQILGMEAAYVGNARTIDALGLNGNARLISNGLEGALRLNIPIVSWSQRSLIEPFGFVGLGWSHYNLVNANVNVSNVASSDDIVTMPFGGGLAFGYGGFVADARFTYRKTYYNNLVTGGGDLDSWGAGGQIGFGF
jgi:hypothetical protein